MGVGLHQGLFCDRMSRNQLTWPFWLNFECFSHQIFLLFPFQVTISLFLSLCVFYFLNSFKKTTLYQAPGHTYWNTIYQQGHCLFIILSCYWSWISPQHCQISLGIHLATPRRSTATLTMLWWNSWSITDVWKTDLNLLSFSHVQAGCYKENTLGNPWNVEDFH